MTAKIESPSKLCPSERLARKRAAARLRQQRCRARKREAMLEERSQLNRKLAAARRSAQDSKQKTSISSAFRRSYPTLNKDMMTSQSSSPQQIYKCVSFESQRSFEEAMKAQEKPSPVGPSSCISATPKATAISSPPRKVAREISIPEEKSENTAPADTTRVPEEEAAAIAAMLSLKTSPTSKKSTYETEHVVRPQHVPPKIPYHRSWESHRYDKSRGYELRPRVSEYYRPSPHYRYYPSFQRYVRYDYE